MNETLEELRQLLRSRGDVRPSDIVPRLTVLGFLVRRGSKAGHWVVAHRGLRGFRNASFCCEHGRNGVLTNYSKKDLLAVLNRYEAQL